MWLNILVSQTQDAGKRPLHSCDCLTSNRLHDDGERDSVRYSKSIFCEQKRSAQSGPVWFLPAPIQSDLDCGVPLALAPRRRGISIRKKCCQKTPNGAWDQISQEVARLRCSGHPVFYGLNVVDHGYIMQIKRKDHDSWMLSTSIESYSSTKRETVGLSGVKIVESLFVSVATDAACLHGCPLGECQLSRNPAGWSHWCKFFFYLKYMQKM